MKLKEYLTFSIKWRLSVVFRLGNHVKIWDGIGGKIVKNKSLKTILTTQIVKKALKTTLIVNLKRLK